MIEVLNPIIVAVRVVLSGARRADLFPDGFAVSSKEFRSRKSVALEIDTLASVIALTILRTGKRWAAGLTGARLLFVYRRSRRA
jgi:hypothetical protein